MQRLVHIQSDNITTCDIWVDVTAVCAVRRADLHDSYTEPPGIPIPGVTIYLKNGEKFWILTPIGKVLALLGMQQSPHLD